MTTSLIVDLDAEVRKFSTKPNGPKATLIVQPSRALAALAKKINAEHTAVITAMNQTLDHAMRCGDLLIEAKSKCAHGEWAAWLKDNFDGSDRSARVYMRLAKHRNVIEAKRQSPADLTIEKALDYIAPRPEKPRAVDPAKTEVDRRECEEQLVESVLVFDDMMITAITLGESPEAAFQALYPESQNQNDQVSFEQYKSEVEGWRAADWYPEAEKRVRQRRDNPTTTAADPTQWIQKTIMDASDALKTATGQFNEWANASREALASQVLNDDELSKLRTEAWRWLSALRALHNRPLPEKGDRS